MAKPKVTILCDFNQDGDFTDANEDITADVRQCIVNTRKNLSKHRADAAVADLILNNDDHKYSPSFVDSPLYPGNLPAPNIWIMIGYPVDDFNAADTVTLSSRKPSHDDLFAAWTGDTGDFDVLSNKIRTATGANKTAVLDFGETDCFVGVKFTRGGTTSGLILRYSNASNFLMVYHDGTNLRLAKVDGGTLTSLGSNTVAWATAAEKRIIVEMHGNDFHVLLDDTLQFTVTNTFNNTATKHGIGGRATHANDRWDDFGGWRPKFFGRVDVIQPRPETKNQYCYIRAYSDQERMKAHLVYRSSPAAPATAKAILTEILNSVDISSTNRILDNGTTLTTIEAHRKSMGRDGLIEAYQVQDDDVGFYYVDGAGIHRYEEAVHRQAAPHTNAIKTWRGDRAAGDETDMYFSNDDFEWDDGKGRIENEAYYFYHKIAQVTTTTVWELNPTADTLKDRPQILDGSAERILSVGSEDQISNPIDPVHVTDFRFNTSADGTGTDLLVPEDTSGGSVSTTGSEVSPTFEVTDVSPNQDFSDWTGTLTLLIDEVLITSAKYQLELKDNTGRVARGFMGPGLNNPKVLLYTDATRGTKGYSHKGSGFDETDTPLTYKVFDVTVQLETGWEGNYRMIRIINGSGATGFLTFLRMRGDKGTKSNEGGARAQNATSIANVGRRRIEHKTLHIDQYSGGVNPSPNGSALDRVAKRIEQRFRPKERVKCHLMPGTRANLMQIVHRSISDRVKLVYTAMGIAEDYHIEGQKLLIQQGGLYTHAEFELQQAIGQPWETGARWNQFQWA